MTSIPY